MRSTASNMSVCNGYPSIYIALAFVLFSCINNDRDIRKPHVSKLISIFHPAFHEFSEITYENLDTIKRLNILIRKNYRIDATQDTFYYKTVKLDSRCETLLQNRVLRHFPLPFTKKSDAIIMDGIPIYYQLIQNTDTTLYEFHSPLPTNDSVAYSFTISTLETYQNLFKDTIVTDYFNELRFYINEQEYGKPATMTPLKQLRKLKYAGKFKYSR